VRRLSKLLRQNNPIPETGIEAPLLALALPTFR
jgi:hypothetical protein